MLPPGVSRLGRTSSARRFSTWETRDCCLDLAATGTRDSVAFDAITRAVLGATLLISPTRSGTQGQAATSHCRRIANWAAWRRSDRVDSILIVRRGRLVLL